MSCARRGAGKEPDVSLAAKSVAESGEFGLHESHISEVYDKIAATVIGFREIPGC